MSNYNYMVGMMDGVSLLSKNHYLYVAEISLPLRGYLVSKIDRPIAIIQITDNLQFKLILLNKTVHYFLSCFELDEFLQRL